MLAAADDASPGQHPVAVLSHDFWMRRFGGDPHIPGRWVTVRDTPLQIVGVAAKGFTGVEPGIMTDLWAPTMMWDGRVISDPATRWLQIWGRVQPGVAPEQAGAVLQTVLTNFWREQAGTRPEDPRDRREQLLNTRVYVRSAATGVSSLRESFERALWLVSGLAALVLLVACANVASLLQPAPPHVNGKWPCASRLARDGVDWFSRYCSRADCSRSRRVHSAPSSRRSWRRPSCR